MAKKTRYDDKFRANALVLLEAAGFPNTEGALTRTASHLGVPITTLSRWAKGESNPPPADVVAEKRAELSSLLRQEIEGALGAMASVRGEASYRDLGTVVGILTDKLQLLTGKPTENNRTRIVIEYADVEIDAAQATRSAGTDDPRGAAL